MKKALLLLIGLVFLKFGNAQNITWAQDIAPLLYANCTNCHHDGGLAPFALINYSDAYSHRSTIKSNVEDKKMPPWPPDATYSRFAHERLLTPSDICKISNWVSQGAPSGDTTTAPTAPTYSNGSQLSSVDLSLIIPTFTVPGNQTTDLYQCFAIPTALLQNKYITGLEIIPGNPEIVHHVLVYQDTTYKCHQLDSASPGPGYTNFGGVGTNKAILVGGWVPGTMPTELPTNFGIKLYKNSYLVLQVHYPAGSAGKTDSTRINLKLASSVSRQVALDPILNHFTDMVNGPLVIPANTVKTFEEEYTLPGVDVSVLTVAPHAHLVNTNWICYAVTPNNDTIPIIKINDWDFHWQGFYQFRNIMKAPAGTKLYGFATYDNTTNNPNNPNNPPVQVTVGESTTDEMMLVYFAYTLYQAGDENIVQDASALTDLTDTTYCATIATGIKEASAMVSTPQLYDASPNPANDQTLISYFLPAQTKAELKIFDLQGRLVDEVTAPSAIGFNRVNYNTSKLQPATYLINLSADGVLKTKQLVISK